MYPTIYCHLPYADFLLPLLVNFSAAIGYTIPRDNHGKFSLFLVLSS